MHCSPGGTGASGVPLRSPDLVRFTMSRNRDIYMMNLAQTPTLAATGSPVRRENVGTLMRAAVSAGVDMSLDWAEKNQAKLAGKTGQLRVKYTGRPVQSKLVVTQLPIIQSLFGVLSLLDTATSTGPASLYFVEE